MSSNFFGSLTGNKTSNTAPKNSSSGSGFGLGSLFSKNTSKNASGMSSPMGTGMGLGMGAPGGGSNTMIIAVVIFILIVILIIVIVVLVNRAKQNKENIFTIIKSPLDAFDIKKNEFKIDNSNQGLEFTYSVWIFIQDWTRGWKNILVKGDKNSGAGTASTRAPGLWLYPDTNALHARINTFASPNEGCDIKNIPLQKWVHITYILNNRTVDIYIDGKLERSCILKGVPKLNNNPLYVCDNGGFFGKISNLVYYKYAIKPNEVYDLYSKGPY